MQVAEREPEGLDQSGTEQDNLLQQIEAPSPEGFPPTNSAPSDDSDAPKGVAYTERVTAFVDILGFKEIVLRSAKKSEPDLIGRIHSALDIGKDDLARVYIAELRLDSTGPDDFDDRFHTFSDCIIISVKPDPLEIGLLVYTIFKVCRRLLQAGFISRGGVSIGDLFHRTDADKSGAPMVFGPAFLDAYALESTHAEGARVILQKTLVKKIMEFKRDNPTARLTKFFTAHIKIADDGPSFIDLFADFPGNCFYDQSLDVSSEIDTIRKRLCEALEDAADKPTQFRKNAMLAREFNAAVQAAADHQRDPALRKFVIPADVLPPRART